MKMRINLRLNEEKLEFLTRLIEQGYPQELAEKILAKVHFSSRSKALQNKTATSNSVLPFVTTFNPATPNLKKDSHETLASRN